MEAQLVRAQEEAALLKAENAASAHQVSQIKEENSALINRLSQVEGATIKLLKGKANSFNKKF